MRGAWNKEKKRDQETCDVNCDTKKQANSMFHFQNEPTNQMGIPNTFLVGCPLQNQC